VTLERKHLKWLIRRR